MIEQWLAILLLITGVLLLISSMLATILFFFALVDAAFETVSEFFWTSLGYLVLILSAASCLYWSHHLFKVVAGA